MIKKVLCLGNNTIDTDTKTKHLSEINKSHFHGLLSELGGVLDPSAYSQPGYYHSSIYDLEFGRLLALTNEFDQVVVLDQNIDQWSHPDAFYRTLQLLSKIKVPVHYLNTGMLDTFNFFSSLVAENKSFCIFPFIELLVNYDYTTVCCRSSFPITKISEVIDYRQDPEYVKIRDKMIRGELVPDH